MNTLRKFWCIVLFLFLGALPGLAQFSSTVQGLIADTSGGSVPQAAVVVTNVATGAARRAITSGEGLYRVTNLGAGAYRVNVEKTGFRSAAKEGVAVGDSETVRVDFVLQLGQLSETVSVEARPSLVETEEGRLSGLISSRQVSDLPLNGRDIWALLALEPGVTGLALSFTGGPGNNDALSSTAQIDIHASGSRGDSTNFVLDGTGTNSTADAGYTRLTPNADSVEEVRVVTNNFSATEGRNSGAQVLVFSKAGTNQFHGGGAYFFENNTLSDRNVFESVASSVPIFRHNDFMAHVGGPIIKNRTFFFVSYEGLRAGGARAVVANVETPSFVKYVAQTEPNSIAAKLLQEFPPVVYPTYNFTKVTPGSFTTSDYGSAEYVPAAFRNGNQFNTRIDQELRPGKDHLYANYYRTSTGYMTGGIRPAFNRPENDVSDFGTVNETHIFSPTIVNELQAGVMRMDGVPEEPPPQLAIPSISIPGITGFGDSSYPEGWFQTEIHAKDTFTWIRSAHTIKIGGGVLRVLDDSHNTTSFMPVYTFASLLNFTVDNALQETREVDPSTGNPASNAVLLRLWETDLFVADDWKVTPNFTLNLGLRYENYGSPNDPGSLRNLVWGSGSTYSERLAGASVEVVNKWYPARNRDFAPRFGFAWNPGGKGRMAIRGGYGIFYDRLPLTPVLPFRADPPLRATATLGSAYGTSFIYSLGNPQQPFLGFPVDPSLRVGLNAQNGIPGLRVALTVVDPNIKPAYSHNWFLGFQREIGLGWVVEVNFVGSAGHNLYFEGDINRYAGDRLAGGIFHGINQNFSNIFEISSGDNSIYLGGTAQLKRAFRQGFTFQSAYTFGRAIDDSDTVMSTTTYEDIANRRLDRGQASFNVPQKFTMMGIWELPFLRGQSGVLPKVLGGWQLTGDTILQDGTPINVNSTAPYPTGDWNADNTTGDRPNAPSPTLKQSGFQRSDYLRGIFPGSAFPRPALGTDGNLGRNAYRGPGFAETDVSLTKKFPITERFSAQLRFDAYNVFNRVNLTNPVTDLSSPSFGQSTSTLTPRMYQVGLRVAF